MCDKTKTILEDFIQVVHAETNTNAKKFKDPRKYYEEVNIRGPVLLNHHNSIQKLVYVYT